MSNFLAIVCKILILLMIGRVLWGEFFNNRDWPAASAVAIVMLILLMIPILIFNRVQQREIEGKLT